MSTRPTHYLSAVSGEGAKARFTRIAPLWPTKTGNGWTGEIPAGIALSGRLVILQIEDAGAKADEA